MIDRARFLVAYGVDADRWARKYNIDPFETECACGETLRTSIPFTCGPRLVGLIAPPCVCGERPPYAVVSRHGGDVLRELITTTPEEAP